MSRRSTEETNAIREAAAEWYWTIREPDVGEAELADWQAWLSASPDHRSAFDRVKHALEAVSAAESPPWPTEQELLQDNYDGSVSVTEWRQTRGDRRQRPPAQASAPSRFALRGATLALAATVAALVVGLAVFRPGLAPGPDVSETATYTTVAAEHRDVMLPDGSSISLAAGTAVSVTYDSDRRFVDLSQGEAYFDVAADPSRPFEVTANGRRMVAVGTAFNVARQAGRVTLTVAEGVVVVERQSGSAGPSAGNDRPGGSSGQFARVEAGQRVSYDDNAVDTVEVADPSDALAWRSGMLKYRGEPLRYVIEDVNRYTALTVAIADDEAAALLFTGTVFQDSAETWVDGLEDAFPVTLERAASGITIHASN